MWHQDYRSGCAGVCGYGYEPITREEKLALLDLKEEHLQEKLEQVRKLKDALKSEKSGKEKS